MYMLEKAETEEELKKIALEKGLIFTRSKMGIDDENSVTILHGAYGKSGMTVQGFIHSKIKDIKVDDGADTGRASFMYRLTITQDQIQFRPKPKTENQRKEEVNFFFMENSGFRFLTLFRKKAIEVKKEVTGETKGKNGSRIDSYPEGWAFDRYANGYREKHYNLDIAKKNREAKFAKRSERRQTVSTT